MVTKDHAYFKKLKFLAVGLLWLLLPPKEVITFVF